MGKNKQKGAEGFDLFYQDIYQDRWEGLKSSLIAQKKHVAVYNPSGSARNDQAKSFYEEELYPKSFSLNGSWDSPENGEYYLMDAASLLPVRELMNSSAFNNDNVKILDMCAAPGGKSVLLSWALNGRGHLTCNDLSKTRLGRLRNVLNLHLSDDQLAQVTTTNYDASRWCLYEKEVFDLILLDAPCSSERHVLTSQKHLDQWSIKRSKSLAIRQWSILASAIDLLKPGGQVVYSTCSISPLENDDVISKMLKKRNGLVKVNEQSWPIGEKTEHGWAILPDKEGWGPFYLSSITKSLSEDKG
jgi:16S rRNA C967 or C1407 C5-methylase (RsmB/RsmF family)